MTDSQLVALVEKNRPQLVAVLVRKGYAHDETEDAIQTLYLELLPNLDRLEKITPSFLSKRVCWIASKYKIKSHTKQTTDLENYDPLVNPTIETEHDIWSAIEHLPTRAMRNLALFMYKGYTIQDVADQLLLPRYKIDALWQETKDHLRKFLKGYRGGE